MGKKGIRVIIHIELYQTHNHANRHIHLTIFDSQL